MSFDEQLGFDPMNKPLIPPDDRRDPINIHPAAKANIYALLQHGELAGTGVGYSEFINNAVIAFKRGEFSILGRS